jgi:hypothetical protein
VPEPRTFDVRELAAGTAHYIVSHEQEWWITGTNMERWLQDAGIARPNGAPGRMELTQYGAELIAALATCATDRP